MVMLFNICNVFSVLPAPSYQSRAFTKLMLLIANTSSSAFFRTSQIRSASAIDCVMLVQWSGPSIIKQMFHPSVSSKPSCQSVEFNGIFNVSAFSFNLNCYGISFFMFQKISEYVDRFVKGCV